MAKGPLGRDRRAVAARVKPGWVRVSFNYFLSDAVADYVMDAARLVARDGWRLLGDYPITRPRGAGPTAPAWSNPRCDSVM